MFHVYQRYLSVLRSLRPVIERIEQRDRDLGRQLRRAACSVSMNLSEGSGSEGGTRRQRHLNALGSAREISAGLDSADALGYVVAPQAVVAELSGIIGTLVVLVHGRRR